MTFSSNGMHGFTPFSALAGGALIGLAASLAMLSHGRVAGISGLFAGALDVRSGGGSSGAGSFARWFLAGLCLAGVLARLLHPAALLSSTPSLLVGGIAGLLVGAGTRLGSGCTSGHGVCGLSHLSKRSLIAVLTFMATGVLTVAVLRALGALS